MIFYNAGDAAIGCSLVDILEFDCALRCSGSKNGSLHISRLVAMIPIPLGGPLGVAAAPGHMALPEAIAGVPANATAAVAISKMRIFQISFVVVLASPP